MTGALAVVSRADADAVEIGSQLRKAGLHNIDSAKCLIEPNTIMQLDPDHEAYDNWQQVLDAHKRMGQHDLPVAK